MLKQRWTEVKYQIPGEKTDVWIKEKIKVIGVIEQVRKRRWTSIECEITDGHRVSPPGNLTKGNDPEKDR